MNKLKKSKELANIENKWPINSKRPKSMPTLEVNAISLTEVGENEFLIERDLDNLCYLESSKSTIIKISEEDLNKTSNDNRIMDTPNNSIYEKTISGFIDPNETLLSCGYKTNNSHIEIYTEQIHNEKFQKKFSQNVYSKSRTPLSTMSCNNISNNITPTSSLDNKSRSRSLTSNEIFFLYRNKDNRESDNKDHFSMLSDEIILQIFKWLPKKALIRCCYVSTKFNRLARDESLWTRLNLGSKVLKKGSIGNILARGVVILRLAQAEMEDPIINPESFEYSPSFVSKLQYLDLSMAVISKPSLNVILSKCNQLKKLSLENLKLNDEICNTISKNNKLEALNLAMCEGIEPCSVKNLMINLQQIHSLNISWTSLNIESVNELVENITPNLLRLNVAGCRKSMLDSHLATLARRCPGILELDISDCIVLTSLSINIICDFKDLEYLSLSRCYGIPATAYMDLQKLHSLSFFDVFGLLSDSALAMLQSTFVGVGINKFIHSSVARPTVGTRRTSIWGLRTRD